ncbi:MAG: hypothetical protein KDB88_10225 [Flavobacteriales bacterium]|nr:hypothetical protein [Flavobacteriales bacterium]
MLHVHIERSGPRARYIIGHVLGSMLGWELRFWNDGEDFASVQGCKLYYGRACPGPDTYWVQCDTPLDEGPNEPMVPSAEPRFPARCGEPAFDLFGPAFHLLSLHEEYRSTETDEHGRMPPNTRWVVRHGLETRPFLDEWALALAGSMDLIWPGALPVHRRYSHWVTIDVDNGSRYIGHGPLRHIAATARDLLFFRFEQVLARWKVVLGKRPDPFDNSAWIMERASRTADRVLFFFLLKGGGRYDHAHAAGSEWFEARVRSVAEVAEIGVHPSYRSSDVPGLMEAECSRAASLAGAPVTSSRQHFLRCRVPDTFNQLIEAGIREEHSIGFRDRCGFLVGTCTPFHWFDIVRNVQSDLLLVPFACMDSALLDVQAEGPVRAGQLMSDMVETVKKVRGTFVSVWHDRHLGVDGALSNVFPEVLETAKP